jgi:hypothetical protein
MPRQATLYGPGHYTMSVIERNYRELEVEQSFSLALFAPDDLAGLRITGEVSLTRNSARVRF